MAEVKLWDSIAPIGIESFAIRDVRRLLKDSIAPIGIESPRACASRAGRAQIQSHLLVLKAASTHALKGLPPDSIAPIGIERSTCGAILESCVRA